MKHPQVLFGDSDEDAIIALSNEYITAGRVRCAAAELPLRVPDDVAYFPPLRAITARAGAGRLDKKNSKWVGIFRQSKDH